MSDGAVEALAADRHALVSVLAGLGDEMWAAPSGCTGWRVQDLVVHMGALFSAVVDRSDLPDTRGLPTEQAQEVVVDARRGWTSARVFEHYETISAAALEVLRALEEQPGEVNLGDLGTHPFAMVPNAYAFDHYTHIRADLFHPRGPLEGPPPPADEQRLAPTLAWIEAALPQHNARLLAGLRGHVEIVVEGPAARTLTVSAAGTEPDPADEPLARVRTSGDVLVRWITQRASWAETGVEAEGDAAALGIIRALHVF